MSKDFDAYYQQWHRHCCICGRPIPTDQMVTRKVPDGAVALFAHALCAAESSTANWTQTR